MFGKHKFSIFSGAFSCENFDDGSSYLIADYSISCHSEKYKLLVLVAVIIVLAVPIGIPAMYSYILWSRRERIKQPIDVRSKDSDLQIISFLFDSYKPQCWHFEIFEACRRLALTGALGALSPGTETQLSGGLLISLCGVVVYSLALPYVNQRNNALAILSNLQVLMVMLTSLVLKYRELARSLSTLPSSALASSDANTMGVLLIVMNVLGFGTVLVYFFTAVMTKWEGGGHKSSTALEVIQRSTRIIKRSSTAKCDQRFGKGGGDWEVCERERREEGVEMKGKMSSWSDDSIEKGAAEAVYQENPMVQGVNKSLSQQDDAKRVQTAR